MEVKPAARSQAKSRVRLEAAAAALAEVHDKVVVQVTSLKEGAKPSLTVATVEGLT